MYGRDAVADQQRLNNLYENPLSLCLAGCKTSAKNGVIEKGWRLDLAARAKLPVPNGGILLDDFYQLAVLEEVVQFADGRLSIPSPQALSDLLYTAVRFPQLDKPAILRPLYETAVPPQFSVNLADPPALAGALAELWAALPAGAETGRDVLLQEMITIAVEGTAVTHSSRPTDTITCNSQTSTLPQLGAWRRPDPAFPAHLRRLQLLLRGLRRTFGAGQWQVQWADDGRVCWLLSLKNITIP
ncbi:MAG: hypothetical protein HC804_05725 [Anaerolineae bacterium]|nr:hypothetical protein [Anaerolineae bacterium]